MTSAPDEPLAATFVGEAPAELRAMLGKSATPFEPPSSPSAVPTPTATPTLTLQQYASLCAELAMFPERTEATFQRYGLASLRDRLAVDLAWQERLRRNPAEHQAWNELYQRWCAHLSATRPRG